MKYFANFQEDFEHGGFVVTFRDIPEAITQGDCFADALHAASDALSTVVQMYEEMKKILPLPSPAQHGEVAVELL